MPTPKNYATDTTAEDMITAAINAGLKNRDKSEAWKKADASVKKQKTKKKTTSSRSPVAAPEIPATPAPFIPYGFTSVPLGGSAPPAIVTPPPPAPAAPAHYVWGTKDEVLAPDQKAQAANPQYDYMSAYGGLPTSAQTKEQKKKQGVTSPSTSPASGNLPKRSSGGYSPEEMEAAFGGKSIDVGRTGFNYANLGPNAPTFTNSEIAATGNSYAGFYLGNNGRWYPIDQSKVGKKGNGGGKRGGGGGGGNGDGGGGGGGGGTASYNVDGAPNWWQGIAIQNPNDTQSYANMLNASIPFMSPEDQEAAATYLSDNFPEFSVYKNIAFDAPPPEMTTDIVDRYTSADRARQYLDTLTTLAQTLGRRTDEMGAGFQLLQNVGNILSRFGGGPVGTSNYQSRMQYEQMLTALDPVMQQAQAQGSLSSAYVPIANYLTNPTFSAGPLVPLVRNADGTYTFGSAQGQLYG